MGLLSHRWSQPSRWVLTLTSIFYDLLMSMPFLKKKLPPALVRWNALGLLFLFQPSSLGNLAFVASKLAFNLTYDEKTWQDWLQQLEYLSERRKCCKAIYHTFIWKLELDKASFWIQATKFEARIFIVTLDCKIGLNFSYRITTCTNLLNYQANVFCYLTAKT